MACDPGSDAGGTNRGAINILFFDANSEVVSASTVTISSTEGGFGTGLANNDAFGGREVAMLGDMNNDGTKELAVGAFKSDGGKGAIWILSLDANNYNVVSKQKITEGMGGFADTLTLGENPNGSFGANFGHALCAPGDLNGDGVPDIITGANQQNEGFGYILYMNADKTVKTFTRLNNAEGGFNLVPEPEERFTRSISFAGDLRNDGTIAVNMGGGAGGTGTLYLLFFKPCDFTQEAGNNHWSDGNTLFSNWDHQTQMLTSDSLTLEQCQFKAFETDATYMTYNINDGRCICKDETATLTTSSELSTAYSNLCFSGITGISDLNSQPSEFVIYPNPVNETINIKLTDSFTSSDQQLLITDATGRQVYKSSVANSQTEQSISVSNFTNGVYLVTLIAKDGLHVGQRLVVQH